MAASGPDVHLTFPTAFSPIPKNLPPTVPPPLTEGSLRAPFGINKDLYNFVLRPEIPILFATAYILLVAWGNVYNRKRKHAPWPVSRKDNFNYFIIVHNVLLALYSFATFVAMFRAISKTLPDWDDASGGLWRAKTADALCKLHGPRGLGDAATFNTTVNIWEAKNSLIKLGMDGVPDLTDVGRLWNEGLAFWGWMFYVSKFYEVIDTVIIVAKGKRSATLQTYHHAGAMLCMWAGIRYMSPPIWMFVFINSAIHAMMYTYFACSALGIQVPQALKRALTSLQIFQFVFGASYAALHLFIKYDMPISVPFQVGQVVERTASSVSSAATAATKSVTSAASSASSFAENPIFGPTAAAFLKKLLLRAAGDEGVAERVALQDQRAALLPGQRSGLLPGQRNALLPGQSIPRIEERMQSFIERRVETRWRQDWTTVNCIDTSGEAFAIYLNLLYLAPLTFLFARFFIRAYTARGKPGSIQEAARTASDAAKDAKNQTEYSVEKAGVQAENRVDEEGRRLQEELKKDVEDFKNGVRSRRISDRVGESIKNYEDKVKEMVNGKSTSGSGPASRKSSPSKQTSQASLREEGSGADGSTDATNNGVEDDKGAPDAKGPPNAKGAGNAQGAGNAKGARDAKEDEDDKGAGDDDASYADVVKQGTDNEEAKKKADDDIAGSHATRPGAEEPSEDDTDAMGKSGAIVDTPDSPDPDTGDGEGKGDDAKSTKSTGGGPGHGLFKE